MTMSDAQFEVDEDGEFYITIAGGATVYESYDDAVAEVGDKLENHDDAFVAETSITGSGEDMSIELEQVSWTEIIPDMNND
jgi:azurin